MSTPRKAAEDDDTKRRFREALAAKQNRRGEDHVEANPAQPHPHGPLSHQKTFRRKTG